MNRLSTTTTLPLLSITGPDNVTTLPKRPKTKQHRHKRHKEPASAPSSGNIPTTVQSVIDDSYVSPRVVLGPKVIDRLPSELGRLQLSTPLIVSSPSRIAVAKKIQSSIPNLKSRILDSSVVNVPSHVVDGTIARIAGHDCVISVGSDSAVNLARSIGLRKGIPHICVPTTYSGSEVTALAAIGRNSHKGSLRESKIPPTVIIYDEDLTTSAPKRFSAPSSASIMAVSAESRHRPVDDGALWSYIHLPGV